MPKIGQIVDLNGSPCVIRAIREFGTIDVENEATGKWYRVTGLSFRASGGWRPDPCHLCGEDKAHPSQNGDHSGGNASGCHSYPGVSHTIR